MLVACERDSGRLAAALIAGRAPDLVIEGLEQIISKLPIRGGATLRVRAPELCVFEVQAWCLRHRLRHISSEPLPETLLAGLAERLPDGFSEAARRGTTRDLIEQWTAAAMSSPPGRH